MYYNVFRYLVCLTLHNKNKFNNKSVCVITNTLNIIYLFTTIIYINITVNYTLSIILCRDFIY